MDKHYFLEILRKYVEGKATAEERQFLINYYNLFRDEPDISAMLTDKSKQAVKKEIKEKIWRNVPGSVLPAKRVSTFRKMVMAGAVAAAVILIMLSGGYYLWNKSSDPQPGSVLATHQKGNRIILLPDGSTVILSPGSKLNYPSSFDGKERREVFLYGQAFFEITPNAAKPFIVHTGKLETVVLGTAFNVKAMPGETDITVTVRDGKVQVNEQGNVLGIITPSQQIVYNKEKQNAVRQTVEDNRYLDWQENELLFDNLTISEAAPLLEEQYSVTITIADQSIGAQRFTASFSKRESLERALESICVFNGLMYTYNREHARVTIGNK